MADKSEKNNDVILAVIQNDMVYMKEGINTINEKLSRGYVTKEEFEPIKKVVYGLVGLILTSVLGALVAIVVNGAQK